jgi:hypothetical protein
MKKILLIIFSFVFISTQASILKGGVSEEYIPKGFFGSWGVISKLDSSNNPTLFNYESRDIWTLSGHSDVLVLQNLKTGARSEFRIEKKPQDGKTLKFEREKIVKEADFKIIYKEIIKFTLLGNNFSGTDNFIVEKYDKKNILIEKNIAKYIVEGIKISGEKPY